jgi:hypothetical protein
MYDVTICRRVCNRGRTNLLQPHLSLQVSWHAAFITENSQFFLSAFYFEFPIRVFTWHSKRFPHTILKRHGWASLEGLTPGSCPTGNRRTSFNYMTKKELPGNVVFL